MDLPEDCSEEKFCTGLWCTKGPDERSNGVFHGCSDVAPVDEQRPMCKDVVSREGHTNCYCNNVDFCNGAGLQNLRFMLISTAFIFLFCLY
ncbi:hypothetical protein L596_014482 [Steinernema carpocapsae]|uniref:Activin types I and II receptor domain-containing protein n=1 Tax=Steinernema carpocapsae TaxID=34508 RepID=A0A4U5NCU8_STECR|nr:hypothetical protein L596_014482 [Steinernema carpocapsae]